MGELHHAVAVDRKQTAVCLDGDLVEELRMLVGQPHIVHCRAVEITLDESHWEGTATNKTNGGK